MADSKGSQNFDENFHRSHIDPSLRNFLIMLTRIILVILLLLTVISLLGINITSFAALLAGLGVALGSALNGALGNFAGGVTILVLKPFREGILSRPKITLALSGDWHCLYQYSDQGK